MQELVAQFVPAADEVHRLTTGTEADCRHFQRYVEQGHYGGRTRPTTTRQGIYAVAPSGLFLGSINSRSARRVAAMLERALQRWQALEPAERHLDDTTRAGLHSVTRWRDQYPADGLVLTVTSRDLPRDKAATQSLRRRRDWRARAFNLDYAWFRRSEARSMLPAQLTAGSSTSVPDALIERLAMFHLIDNVRGQTDAYRRADIELAELDSEVQAVDGCRVTIALRGETRARHADDRGFASRLNGHATWDTDEQRFVAFELVAAGERWGRTRYNARGGDAEPAPIGVVFELAPGDARVAPAFIWRYGWSLEPPHGH